MPPREMHVQRRVLQLLVTHQELKGWQIGPTLNAVRRERMPQRMRAEALRESGPARTFATGMPYCFVGDRPLLISLLESRGEQVDLRLHFAGSPVCSQRLEQLWRERQFPIA